jgi:serine/threonine protein phosphatase PrpC
MSQSMPTFFSLWFNAEKILDHGEDADPLVMRRPEYGVLLGVFDGMGGSGAQTYRTESGDHSGAYLASRHAQATSGKWFETVALPPTTDAELAVSLSHALATAMRAHLATLGAKPSRIASRMIRQQPTTAALLVVNTVGPTSAEATVRCHALWAGDSRAFVLTGQEGLAQLTTDHLRSEGDAQENLMSDSPMSNFVSASQPFEIDHRSVQPGWLITACAAITVVAAVVAELTGPTLVERLTASPSTVSSALR